MYFPALTIVWIINIDLCAGEELRECELLKDIVGDILKRVGQCLFHEWQNFFQEEIEITIDGRIDDISEGLFATKQIV